MYLPLFLLAPAVVIGIVILSLRQALVRSQAVSDKLITYTTLLLGMLGLIWGLSRLGEQGVVGVVLQIFVLPHLLTGIAGLFVYTGWQSSEPISRPFTAIGMGLLILACWLVYDLARFGSLVAVFAFLTLFTTISVALVLALWLASSLQGKRKGAAFLVGVLFPIGLFLCMQWGHSNSPVQTTERNGDKIVVALESYYLRTGGYPSNLFTLIPQYFRSLPEALTTQKTGWMYTTTFDEFTLGYWYYPDKFGADVCLYQSQEKAWECEFNNWGPFPFVPTPGPPGWESILDVPTPQP